MRDLTPTVHCTLALGILPSPPPTLGMRLQKKCAPEQPRETLKSKYYIKQISLFNILNITIS